MTPSSRPWWKRLLPQTVRARLTVLYALLFLAAGATLLGITYGLVASTLPATSTPTQSKSDAAVAACKAEIQSSAIERIGKPQPLKVPAACKQAFTTGAKVGASKQRQQTLDRLGLLFLGGLGVMTVLAGGLGWVMAGRVLRPVEVITDAAQRASEEHLGERLRLEGPEDELKRLADTFDDMLDRLDASFAGQKRFVSDASHELRTPLTVMRTSIDVTLAKEHPTNEQLTAMAVKVRRYVDHAEELIDALLTLARSSAEPPVPEDVDLAALADDALSHAGTAIAEGELRVVADLEPAPTSGDPVLLGRLVANLVDNAVKHNNAGGWVNVATGIEHGATYLRVANSGPTVPDDMVDALFEPFRRVEARTNGGGAGLGLAIVRSIATAHGATVEARSRSGGGLQVSVVIPHEGVGDDGAGAAPADRASDVEVPVPAGAEV